MSGIDILNFEDALVDRALRPVFDKAVAQVNDGSARVRTLRGERASGFIVDGHHIFGPALVDFVLGLVPADEFDDLQARAFTERMRLLLGWGALSYGLHLWVETRVRDPYFVNAGTDWMPNWVRIPDADASGIPESFFRFACYIALGDLKHGASHDSISANNIFDWVTALGSRLPVQLKKFGSGDLPVELASFRGDGVSAKANDALAVVRIVVTEEREAAYSSVLNYLIRLLETTDFPRSYSIEFRGPTKVYLPIKGLPRKGVHQLCASAAEYPDLHPVLACYAKAAMREFGWYQNLDGEDCAMPGTFAVFALGMADLSFAPLVTEYLQTVDGEHQSLQAKFVEAYIDRYGFTREAITYLGACAGNIQDMRHRKAYAALIANRGSLEALRAVNGSIAGSEQAREYAWRLMLYVIWGAEAERDGGRSIVDRSPAALRPLYREIFAQ